MGEVDPRRVMDVGSETGFLNLGMLFIDIADGGSPGLEGEFGECGKDCRGCGIKPGAKIAGSSGIEACGIWGEGTLFREADGA